MSASLIGLFSGLSFALRSVQRAFRSVCPSSACGRKTDDDDGVLAVELHPDLAVTPPPTADSTNSSNHPKSSFNSWELQEEETEQVENDDFESIAVIIEYDHQNNRRHNQTMTMGNMKSHHHHSSRTARIVFGSWTWRLLAWLMTGSLFAVNLLTWYWSNGLNGIAMQAFASRI